MLSNPLIPKEFVSGEYFIETLVLVVGKAGTGMHRRPQFAPHLLDDDSLKHS